MTDSPRMARAGLDIQVLPAGGRTSFLRILSGLGRTCRGSQWPQPCRDVTEPGSVFGSRDVGWPGSVPPLSIAAPRRSAVGSASRWCGRRRSPSESCTDSEACHPEVTRHSHRMGPSKSWYNYSDLVGKKTTSLSQMVVLGVHGWVTWPWLETQLPASGPLTAPGLMSQGQEPRPGRHAKEGEPGVRRSWGKFRLLGRNKLDGRGRPRASRTST